MNAHREVQAVSKEIALAYVHRLEKLIDYEERLADNIIMKNRRRVLIARAKRMGGLK
jgi:hypothetical protein